MNACACSEHPCSGWGPMFAVHTNAGAIPLCRHCFTMGHSWREEMAHMQQLEELAEGFPEHYDDPLEELQRDADRFHGRAS